MRQFAVAQPPVGSVRFQSFRSNYRALGASFRALLADVRAMDEEGFWRHEGCKDMAMWLQGTLGISRFKAGRMVQAAAALEHLPRLAAALEEGAIDPDKALELSRFATAGDEAALLRWAERVSLRRVRERGDEVLKEGVPARAVEVSRRLTCSLSQERDRMTLYGECPVAEGKQIQAALDRVAKTIPELPQEERPEWMEAGDLAEQRRFDALWLLATTSELGGRPSVPEVVVHTTVDAAGGDGGELVAGIRLHSSTISRLRCDCRLRFVLTGEEGNALGIGDSSRTPPRWLEQQVRRRDGHRCSFPGCHHRHFLQSHHIVPVPGGPTDLDNLVTVCFFHHKLVHEYGWRVSLGDRGAEWCRPDGTPFNPRAPMRGGP